MSVRRLASLISPFRGRSRPASRRPARIQGPESLEPRTVMAVFTVVAPNAPVSAVNFRSLQEALAAAAATGDTIRISPFAVVDDLSVNTTLSANAAIGATTIKTPASVPFGQEIRLDDGVVTEDVVVVGSQPVAGGLFQLTLAQPLVNAFSSGDAVSTTGKIAITKSVTLTSVNGLLPGAIDDGTVNGLQVWADDVIFRNLLVGTGINIMPDADRTFFRNCVLSDVSDTPSAGSGARTFTDNVFFGNLVLRDDGDATTFDRVLYNQFEDTTLRLINNDDASVRGNTFSMVGAGSAIRVEAGNGVVLRQNAIRFANPVGTGDPTPSDGSIGILATGGGAGNDLDVQMLNNSLDTGGIGIGIFLNVNDVVGGGTNYEAILQGNDFHWNGIGLLVDGDGTATATALGTVDAGGGSLSSLGGNNFRGFTPAAASANTAFAIYLANGVNATTDVVNAQNNLWITATPTQVVKDSANNTAAGGWATGDGVGTASVGASQLTDNQQFVQSLYNEFLGRSGTTSEVNFWATKIDLGTATRQQVATSIITSQQAYGYYVDVLYHSILQRSADASGRSSWITQLQGGASKESVAASLTASDEYFSKLSLLSLESSSLPIQAGVTGDPAYVTSLYERYLQRLPTNSELSSWLAAGPMTSSRRLSMAQSILASSEFRTLLIQDGLYYDMLNRLTPPTSAEVSSWNNSGQLLTQLQIAFASTNEYFVNG